MKLALASADHSVEQEFVMKQRTGGDGMIDARDVHVHDAPGADIEVTDLAIAHLAFGQSDGGA